MVGRVILSKAGHFRRFLKNAKSKMAALYCDENGATAIEYALIGALIGLGIIFSVGQVGTTLSTFFSGLSDSFGGDGGE
jgi:pilus assembly protein Flp/PilA